jgi:hypothetical protein
MCVFVLVLNMVAISDSFADQRLQTLAVDNCSCICPPTSTLKQPWNPFNSNIITLVVAEHENLIDGNVTNERHYAETGGSHYCRHVTTSSRFPTLPPEFPLGSIVYISLFISLYTCCSRDNIALKMWIFPQPACCLKEPPLTLKRWVTLTVELCGPLALAGTLSSLIW